MGAIGLSPKYKKRFLENTELYAPKKQAKIESPKFTPNPGGQEQIFNDLTLDRIYNGEYRWYWILWRYINSTK